MRSRRARPGLTALAIATAVAAATPVLAQMDPQVEAALEAGAVGEQADGYLGLVRPADAELRAKVDAINIRRREGYTRVAQTRDVAIEAFAASIGCRTLANLREGRAYGVGGAWAVRHGAIRLPPQCEG